jgi:hypothetical protein
MSRQVLDKYRSWCHSALNNATMAPQLGRTLSILLALLIYSSRALSLVTRVVSTNSGLELEESYDYVIIGGGTSGLVVANRLTEDPDSR